jgi:hypothetical protein
MMGTLLRMGGKPTITELKDFVLKWVVLMAEDGEGEFEDSKEIGTLLIRAYALATRDEDEDDTDAWVSGQALYDLLFKSFCKGYKPRIVRELKRRELEHGHVTDEWVREREVFQGWWIESFDIERAQFPRALAITVGKALGENAAADGVAMWAFHDQMEAQRAGA